mmetsp:Transcript_1248/g.2637  ORF Transcript_1248/g.2637 Transcript_1248/m.2637 type:complete len:213 (-) Transcript_1248:207-845(-)
MKISLAAILISAVVLIRADRVVDIWHVDQDHEQRILCPAILCPAIACLPPPPSSFPASFESFSGSAVFQGVVLTRLTSICVGSQHFYLVQVKRTFKGCPPSARKVIVELPCFANPLTTSSNYIFLATLKRNTIQGRPWYTTGGCNDVYPAAASSIQYANRRRNAEICPITGKCLNGQDLVQCLINPCVSSPCPNPASVCFAHYCGGCKRLCL